MSQTTRCPSCGTKFKVVADQLRISQGWVRCGQCEQVFDATLTLETPGMAAPAPAPVPIVAAPVQSPEAAQAAGYALPTAVEDDEDLPPAQEGPEPEPEREPQSEAEAEAEAAGERAAAPLTRAEALTDSEPEDFAAPPLEPELPADPVLAPLPEPQAVPDFAAEQDSPGLAQLPEAEPGFVRAARRKAFWQAPGVRLALGLGSAVLLLGLALQVALQERNALAAWQPSLRPALQGLCALSGCTLSARQDISQVVISSSAFTRSAQADSYLLSLTIENQAGTELAMPAVELTLTDLQDQPVLRRVLLPADLQAPDTLGAQAEWSVRIPLAVSATPTRIAGYRALVFYP